MRTISEDAIDIRIVDQDLPVLSAVATRVLAMLGDDQSDLNGLLKLIRLDAALTAKILRLANSPMYGGLVEARSIDQAILRLGAKALKQAVLIAATGEVFDQNDTHAQEIWSHSLAVGVASQALSIKVSQAKSDEAFVAGVLHDIGKLALYSHGPKDYGDLIDETRKRGVRFYRIENEQIRYCSHETVGALIGRKWRLGGDILEVIRFHHVVEDKPEVCRRAAPIVNLVSVANLLAIESGFGMEDPDTIAAWDSEPARCLGLGEDDLGVVKEDLPGLIQSQCAALG